MPTPFVLPNQINSSMSSAGVDDDVNPSRGSVRVPAKMGEFVQGVIDGDSFIVSAVFSSPALQTSAQVTEASPNLLAGVFKGESSEHTAKTSELISILAKTWGLDQPLHMQLWNPSPVGKGFGTSSSDMSAAAHALANWAGHDLEDGVLYRALCQVERSDFLLRPDLLSLAYPETGHILPLGSSPVLCVVYWDDAPEETVSTEAVAHLDQQRGTHQSAYRDILKSLTGPAEDFARAVTLSSVLNNRYLEKATLSEAIRVARQVGGGVISAHSGTALGITVSDSDTAAWVIGRIQQLGLHPALGQFGVVI
jgi:uncharacterized protein involved in propanediol utilization